MQRWVFLFILLSSNLSLAQNVQRLEEEAIKDKEREVKVQQYIQQRKKEEADLLAKPITDEDIENKQLVEVEPLNVLPADLANVYSLVPYGVRRTKWGADIGLAYGKYAPINFESKYIDPTLVTFEDTYGSSNGTYFEIYSNFKRNIYLGSLGADIGVGVYNNNGNPDLIGDAKLSLKIIRAGGKLILDNLFSEPYVAPYGSAGVYTVMFSETQGNIEDSGTTAAALYYGVGIAFQMNWLDPGSAVESYLESGIENTFLFIEAKQYMASSNANDPDFSTDLDLSFGMSIEL